MVARRLAMVVGKRVIVLVTVIATSTRQAAAGFGFAVALEAQKWLEERS